MLQPCAQCRRHVDADERVCPFCGAELVAKSPTPLVVAPGRLSRAAIFAGATLAGSACGSSSRVQTPTPIEQTQESPAQTTSAIEQQRGIAAGTITGVITSSDTTQPVPDVTVRVVGPLAVERRVQTDATGTYVFTNLPPGDYVLEWTLDGVRGQPAQKRIEVGTTAGQRIDLTVYTPPPMPDNMPYGAPPRRKRVV